MMVINRGEAEMQASAKAQECEGGDSEREGRPKEALIGEDEAIVANRLEM